MLRESWFGGEYYDEKGGFVIFLFLFFSMHFSFSFSLMVKKGG